MHVVWDITSKCNLRCIHCYNSRLYRGASCKDLGPDLDTEEAFEILDKLADGGVGSIQFLGGEPFVRDDFIDILNHAGNVNISCKVTTNGVLLNEVLIRKLASASLQQIMFSIDGATSESHDAVRGKGVFNRAIDNLRLLSCYFNSNNIKICSGITCTLNTINIGEIEEVVSLSEKLGLDGVEFEITKTLSETQRQRLKGLRLSYSQRFRAGEEIASLMASNDKKIEIQFATWGVPKFRSYLNDKYGLDLQVGRSCTACSEMFYIRADGIAHPCNYCSDFDENVLSPRVKKEKLNLKVLPFDQVVDSEYFRNLYNLAHDGALYEKIDYCKECELYEICDPCPLDVLRVEDKVASECMSFEEYSKETNTTNGKVHVVRED